MMRDEYCDCSSEQVADDGTYHYAFCEGRAKARADGRVTLFALAPDGAGGIRKVPVRNVGGRWTRV